VVLVSTGIEEMGPVDYLVVEFPGNRMTGEGLPLLVDLVDRGIIRILDLTFLTKDADGSVTALELSDLPVEATPELSVFEGANSGLLADDDLAEAASAVAPGSSAGILVYENTWAAPLASAVRRGGGQLVAGGRIPIQALIASLTDEEAQVSGGSAAAST
jgi:hypothetical protein